MLWIDPGTIGFKVQFVCLEQDDAAMATLIFHNG